MNRAQAVQSNNVLHHKIVATSNVVPLRSARSVLDVYLTGKIPQADLTMLLHSPLGVYVTRTETVRDAIHVVFDIAFEDFDFTLHTLMSTLPEATIGAMNSRTAAVGHCVNRH